MTKSNISPIIPNCHWKVKFIERRCKRLETKYGFPRSQAMTWPTLRSLKCAKHCCVTSRRPASSSQCRRKEAGTFCPPSDHTDNLLFLKTCWVWLQNHRRCVSYTKMFCCAHESLYGSKHKAVVRMSLLENRGEYSIVNSVRIETPLAIFWENIPRYTLPYNYQYLFTKPYTNLTCNECVWRVFTTTFCLTLDVATIVTGKPLLMAEFPCAQRVAHWDNYGLVLHWNVSNRI